jgi:hypothetical protein
MREYQEVLKRIWERSVKEFPKNIMSTPYEISVLYRGYKIQYLREIDIYLLFQIRTTPYYKYVETEDFGVFDKYGLRVVADRYQIQIDEIRLSKFNIKIAASDGKLDTSMVKYWKKQRAEVFDRLVQVEKSLKLYLQENSGDDLVLEN